MMNSFHGHSGKQWTLMIKLLHETLQLGKTTQEASTGICISPNLFFTLDLFSKFGTGKESALEFHFGGKWHVNHHGVVLMVMMMMGGETIGGSTKTNS